MFTRSWASAEISYLVPGPIEHNFFRARELFSFRIMPYLESCRMFIFWSARHVTFNISYLLITQLVSNLSPFFHMKLDVLSDTNITPHTMDKNTIDWKLQCFNNAKNHKRHFSSEFCATTATLRIPTSAGHHWQYMGHHDIVFRNCLYFFW